MPRSKELDMEVGFTRKLRKWKKLWFDFPDMKTSALPGGGDARVYYKQLIQQRVFYQIVGATISLSLPYQKPSPKPPFFLQPSHLFFVDLKHHRLPSPFCLPETTTYLEPQVPPDLEFLEPKPLSLTIARHHQMKLGFFKT